MLVLLNTDHLQVNSYNNDFYVGRKELGRREKDEEIDTGSLFFAHKISNHQTRENKNCECLTGPLDDRSDLSSKLFPQPGMLFPQIFT